MTFSYGHTRGGLDPDEEQVSSPSRKLALSFCANQLTHIKTYLHMEGIISTSMLPFPDERGAVESPVARNTSQQTTLQRLTNT